MKSTALKQLETLLESRKLGGTLLTARAGDAPVDVVPTGDDVLDARLRGGWPLGALSEVTGRVSSGRTRLVVDTLAAATRTGRIVALVDGFDRFDARMAAEAGLDLSRVLWVRGAPVTVELARPAVLDRSVRVAVRAFDLLLRAGGFGVVVLDLADAPVRALGRLPASTWLRLAHVNEGRPTAGLLVGPGPMGRSARGVSVRLAATPVWRGASVQHRRFVGFRTSATVEAAHLHDTGGLLESCG